MRPDLVKKKPKIAAEPNILGRDCEVIFSSSKMLSKKNNLIFFWSDFPPFSNVFYSKSPALTGMCFVIHTQYMQ